MTRRRDEDLVGQRFGMLVVLHRSACGVNRRRHKMWDCLCDCGRTISYVGYRLGKHKRPSCGCVASRQTHGGTHRREYVVWKGMRVRCTKPWAINYPLYGGRGITICDRWRNSFQAFLDDMGPRPSADHSIERIDNDRGYEPGNVRWATRVEQGRNKRSNHLVTVGDETLPVSAWAERAGMNPRLIRERLARGWEPARAISTPPLSPIAPHNDRASWTHCPRGHEFTVANTAVHNGRRRCRACANARSRRYHAERTCPDAAQPLEGR